MSRQIPTVAQDWQEFREMVLRGGEPADYERARMIFYAGYRSAMTAVQRLPDVDRTTGARVLESLYAELTEFETAVARRAGG